MSNNSFDQINFHSRDWALMRDYLEQEAKTAMEIMCQDLSIDEVNRLRGRILFIKMMLKRAESTIARAAANSR